MKKIRIAGYPDLQECLIKWFKQCRDCNLPIGGNELKEKEEQFAQKLGHKDFKSSNGWPENFKNRHNIVFRKLCGESQSVSDEFCSEWIKNLPYLLQEPDSIFNADETGLFFKALADKTAVFQGETCHGGKQSKERVTWLLATNMSGTEELTPLMIRKSRNPRCFKGIKSFPLLYKANTKAWMTSEFFSEWLKQTRKCVNRKRKLFYSTITARLTALSLKRTH
ncbi:Tigger transposable element-derived protein 4 [Araneus ventricosus]|uniref:Tigger transposable element-derived protein 4 n=1 Tax=Araneus ventricosus TaxID=182803 RepID=A0A4Y2F260_ARAVE|nr:Tigger transposable element-derived protein 4 [Araneus ventricosus]